jgi:hypothetical protein
MENIIKPKGALKSQKPESGGAVLRQLPMLGVVKDNVDPTRQGRIRVFISALGGKDPDDERNWTPILFMSPFYGNLYPSGGKTGNGDFKTNPASYGMWNSPPDIGTTVICLFINGDPNFGFYIGSIPEPETLRMVPAIGGNFDNESVIFNSSEANSYGGATRVPVTNMNTNNASATNNETFLNAPKPLHSYQASIMFQQGVLRDRLRGPISSSAQRETPSRVGWGVSTPGRPIYEGGFTDETIADAAKNATSQTGLKVISRRGGHSIVLDDGDLVGQDNLIRIRTSQGHQILMSDDGQTLLLLHSNGQSYIELGKEGTVDVFSTNSINLRTCGDLNLHADNNININAQKKLNIQADEININSETNINQKSGKDYKIYTKENHTHKVDGGLSLQSKGDASLASDATTYINGKIINLNTGKTSLVPPVVPPIPFIAQTDTLYDAQKGWAAAPAKLLTIASRAPAHMPWANAGQGVDVKVNLNASQVLSTGPAGKIQAANNNAATASNVPVVTVAGSSTVPTTSSVSKALDKNTTSALVGQMAVQAQTGSAASAIQAGAGLVKNTAGQVTGIAAGTLGMTAKQLEAGNLIKPGASTLVNSLVQRGSSLPQSLPANLFTGSMGVGNLDGLIKNTSAQVAAAVSNLQQSQTALTRSGLLTGKESGNGIGGVIMSAATNGVSATINTIKNISGSVGGAVSSLANNIVGTADSVMKSINGGNFAANLSGTITGGLAGISKAIGSMSRGLSGVLDAAKSVATNAFNAITSAFKPFSPNVPQNLKAIAEGTTQPESGIAEGTTTFFGESTPFTPIGVPTEGGTGTTTFFGDNTPSGTTTFFGPAADASGLGNIPGGSKTVSNLMNNSLSNSSLTLPGVGGIKSLIDNSISSVTNNISLGQSLQSSQGLLSSQFGNINQALTGALGNLRNNVGSLAGLLSAGLPAGAAAQINSAIASISSGGQVPIKIPTVAVNTINRGEITASINSLLPNGVPNPNFTGIPTQSVTSLAAANQSQANTAQRLAQLQKDRDQILSLTTDSREEYFKLKEKLPEGSVELQSAYLVWRSNSKILNDLQKEIDSLTGYTNPF